MNILSAYKGKIEGEHVICRSCPEAIDAEITVRSLEKKKELSRLIEGFIDYTATGIKFLLECEDCARQTIDF